MKEKIIEKLFLSMAFSALIVLSLITIFIFREGTPLIFRVGVSKFVAGVNWLPRQGIYGILPMIIGSLWVTVGALLLGVPLGLAVAVFSAEFAPSWAANIIRPVIQLLAGIPSVIYGFLGLVVLVPWIRTYLGGPGLSILAASLILGIMILPNIISISEDALRMVPEEYKHAALALGATQWQTIYRVLIPAARSGILASVILGIGRAVGETMAVIMVIGNAPQLPHSLLEPARTLTSHIGIEMAYASGEHREALFATGVILFIIIMLLNTAASIVFRRRVS